MLSAINIISEADHVPGWMTRPELACLVELAQRLRPHARWLELGAWCGRSTLAVGLALPEGSSLFVVDPHSNYSEVYRRASPDPEWPYKRFNQTMDFLQRKRPDLLISHFRHTTAVGLPRLPNGFFDVAFVDADHSYKGVLFDCELCEQKLRPDSLLCGHDYNDNDNPEVKKAIDDRYGPRAVILPGTTIWTVQLCGF